MEPRPLDRVERACFLGALVWFALVVLGLATSPVDTRAWSSIDECVRAFYELGGVSNMQLYQVAACERAGLVLPTDDALQAAEIHGRRHK